MSSTPGQTHATAVDISNEPASSSTASIDAQRKIDNPEYPAPRPPGRGP